MKGMFVKGPTHERRIEGGKLLLAAFSSFLGGPHLGHVNGVPHVAEGDGQRLERQDHALVRNLLDVGRSGLQARTLAQAETRCSGKKVPIPDLSRIGTALSY